MIPNINNLITVDLLQRFKNKYSELIITPIVGQIDGITNKIPAEASSSNQLADKAYVTREVSKMDTLTPVVTDELPVASSNTLKKLYLIPSSNGQGSNVKDEYITVVSGLDLYSNYAGTWNHPVTYKGEAAGWYPDADVPGRDKTIGEILLHHDSDLSDLLHSETVEAIEVWEGDYYGGYSVSLGDAYKLAGEILIATPAGWKTEQQIRECNPELDGYDWRNIYAWEKIGSTAMSVDSAPTPGSNNLVKSGGVYSAIENAKNAVKNAVKVTTAELRNLVGSQGLSSGTWYEITDYRPAISDATAIITIGGQSLHPTIINDPNTAMYHDLSLYVLALGVETLSDEGFAVSKVPHNSMLWKVCVLIGSGGRRPSWADSSKPWVYWMQDLNGNEAPFDFINIGFTGTLDSTINTEGGITNGILPQTSNGWYAFNSTTITMGSTVMAINGSIGGTCKNCKITGYNIIFGKADGITIEGSGNIVRNTDNSNSLKNVIVRGDDNKLYTVHYADGSNSVVQGYSNIIVNSTVTMGKNNAQNIIKNGYKVVFGENNSYFEIDDASAVTIGNNNQYWDIEASDNIVIGDNNVGSSSTHCLIGTTTSRDDGDISENVTIGNHNIDIRIKNARNVTIGNNNNTITCLYPSDGDGMMHTIIGSKNTNIDIGDFLAYSIIGNNNDHFFLYGSYIKIGSWNRYLKADDVSRLAIGDNNQFGDANYKSIGNVGSIYGGDITIGSNNKWIFIDECSDVVIGNNNGCGNSIAVNISAGIYLNESAQVYIGNGNAKTPASTVRGGINIDSCTHVTVGCHNEKINVSDECGHIQIEDDNNTIIIEKCSNVNIGTANYKWEITHANEVNIGNNNNSEDRYNTIHNYHDESEKDELDNVSNINIGDNNVDIGLEITSNITIGNDNHRISFEQEDDYSEIYDIKIGDKNSDVQLITDDNVYKIVIENNNAGLNLGVARNVIIKNNNSGIELGQDSTVIEQLTINDNCSHIMINQYDDNSVNAVVLAGTDGNNESITLSPDADGYTQILTYNRGWDKLDRSVWLSMH